MEADWSTEVGSDLPEIVAPWDGFVDLRIAPETVAVIEEAGEYQNLREALLALNATNSPVFTSKCDVWLLDSDEIDPFELESDKAAARTGIACYIDALARDSQFFTNFDLHELWARLLVEWLRPLAIRNGRADVVIRGAAINGAEGFAMTLYAAGCGFDAESARTAWESVLRAAVTATMESATSAASSLEAG